MKNDIGRESLKTEQQNQASSGIDSKSTDEILRIINSQDKLVADAVEKVLPQIADTVELVVETLKEGGRVIYIGAGTSGRLGVLDASEIPPTFSAPHSWFQGVIAGGKDALVRSIEGAEDKLGQSRYDLEKIGFSSKDILIGIASSSTTPYVVDALEYAREIGARTVFLICNPSPLNPVDVDVLIPVDIGQEILTGSTRMKSGTATKMILNSISTTSMIKLGKVYDNLMVDLMVTNKKLEDRGKRIISKVAGIDGKSAGEYLLSSSGSVKTAIVMAHYRISFDEAVEKLKNVNGHLRKLIG